MQHFFNLFLLIFIIRSGTADPQRPSSAVLDPAQHPGQGLVPHPEAGSGRSAVDGEAGLHQPARPGRAARASGTRSGWPAGGISASTPCGCSTALVFYVLLFTTGQWRRVVPTSWAVFPNAVSVLIQYLSLHWPTENGWVAYNSLQLLAYFITIFVAAPLAFITGLGMSPALSTRFKRISRLLSIQTARSLHFLVLVLVPVLHRHPRHAGVHDRPAAQPQPHLRRPQRRQLGRLRDLRRLDGRGRRRLGGGDPVHPAPPAGGAAGRVRADRPGAAAVRAPRRHARASTPRRTSRRTSGTTASTPTPPSTRALFDGNFADYRLRINGLVEQPVELSLAAAAGAAAPRADHPALLHPGLVGHRQVGRRVDADHHRPRPARSPRRSGSSSTRSATAPTRASTTTRTRSSR